MTKPLPPVERASGDHGQALIAAVRAGDASAFRRLFDAYYAPLCGFAHSYVHDAATAEEVVQEVFYAIWRQRETWAPEGGVRAYLFGAIRNRAIGALRHEAALTRAATRSAVGSEPFGASIQPTGAAAAEAADFVIAFRRALHRLPEGLRTVVSLRWQHDCSHAEIAHLLGISVKGVEIQLTRALKRIRQDLAAFRE